MGGRHGAERRGKARGGNVNGRSHVTTGLLLPERDQRRRRWRTHTQCTKSASPGQSCKKQKAVSGRQYNPTHWKACGNPHNNPTTPSAWLLFLFSTGGAFQPKLPHNTQTTTKRKRGRVGSGASRRRCPSLPPSKVVLTSLIGVSTRGKGMEPLGASTGNQRGEVEVCPAASPSPLSSGERSLPPRRDYRARKASSRVGPEGSCQGPSCWG